MFVQCNHCNSTEDRGGLDAFAHGFGFKCVHCDQVNIVAEVSSTVPPEGLPAVEKDVIPPSETPLTGDSDGTECPKCKHLNPSKAEACHRCGLKFAYAASGQAAFAMDPLHRHPAAETIREKWRFLAANLDQRDGHLRFIELCREQSLLQFAGQCYRELETQKPEDERLAEYRNRVIAASMIGIDFKRPRAKRDGGSRLKGLLILSVAALILLGFALGYYFLTQQQITWQHNG